jgi:hypothetical protein
MASRPVLHFGGRGELTTHFHARNENGLEVRSGGIERGCVSGWAGANDDQVVVM